MKLLTPKTVYSGKEGGKTPERRTSHHPFRRDIQGLRALAVLVVIAYHFGGPVPNGFLGVDLFFVVSGFVITLLLESELRSTGSIHLRGFAYRRIRRLLPALLLMLCVTMPVAIFVLSPFGPAQDAALTAMSASLSLANFTIPVLSGDYFGSASEGNPYLHTWSLSVEEQVYIGVLVLLFLSRVSPLKLKLRLVVALLSVSSLLFYIFGQDSLRLDLWGVSFELWGFYSPISRLWEFGCGAIAASLVVSGSLSLSQRFRTRLALSAASVLLLVLFFPNSWDLPLKLLTVLTVVSAAAILVAQADNGEGALPKNIFQKFLESTAMVSVGNLSYSLYLWHWPVYVLAEQSFPNSRFIVVATFLTLSLAATSYFWVEQPIRNGAIRPLRLLPLALIPLVIGILGHGLASSAQRGAGDPAALPAGYDLGCHITLRPNSVNPAVRLETCEFNSDSAGPKVFLVGDSHAAHFTAGLVRSTQSLGLPLVVATASACPLLVGVQPQDHSIVDAGRCGDWQTQAIQLLNRSDPGIVVLGASDGYWRGERFELYVDGRRLPASGAPSKAYDSGIRRLAGTLLDAGHEVILIQTVPTWRGENTWSLQDCATWYFQNRCLRTMALEQSLSTNDAAREVEFRLAESGSVRLADFGDKICPEGKCDTFRGGRFIYSDGSHLTNSASLALEEDWTRILKGVSID